jgi:Flp pilus assembly protein TadD
MDNFKFLVQLFLKPASAMSQIMDGGSWIFAAVGVVILSFGLGLGINGKIRDTYAVTRLDSIIADSSPDSYTDDGMITADELENTRYIASEESYNDLLSERRRFPIIGSAIFWLFSFDSSLITPLIVLCFFYLPSTIITASIVGRLGNPGVVMRRDYATLVNCGLMAWIAAHLPFVIAGLFLSSTGLDGSVFFGLWIASGFYFGVLMIFALRTIFGLEYAEAAGTIAVSWISYSVGLGVVAIVGPWLFSPFLIIIALLFFGGYVRNEVAGLGNAMRGRRDFKRHLHNATVNPNDADAHVQLGLIYSSRRQVEKAAEHFQKAFDIDNEEIDANFELGKLARTDGEFQKAIEYFSVVVEQNDKYSVSEIWREIGLTYLEAGMLNEAETALSKFVKRRAFDSEGLYHYGMILKKQDKHAEAGEMFERAVDAIKTAPYHRRRELIPWARLARREL